MKRSPLTVELSILDKIHIYTVYPLRHSKKTMTKFTSTLCTHWDTARRQWQNSRLHCVPIETQQEDNDKIHVYTVYPLRHSKKTMTKFTSTLCTHWDTARRQWQNSRLHCVPTETQQEDNDKIHVYTVYPLRHSKKTMTKFTSTLCTHWDTARRQWQNSRLHCVPTETQQEDNDKIHVYTVYPLRHSKKTMTKFTSTLCTHWDTARRQWQNSRLHCVPTETQQEDNDKIHVYTVYPLRHSKKTMTKFTSTLCTHWDTARRQWQNSRLHCVPTETQQEDNDKIHVYTVYPLRHSKKTMTKFTSTLCTHWDTARRQWQNSRLHCVPTETQQEDNDKIHVYTVYPLRHSKKTMTKFTSTLCTHWDTARRQWQNSRLHCVPTETQQEDNDKIHVYTVYPLRHSKKTMTKFTSTLCTHWDTARRQWQNSRLHCVPTETQQEDNDKIHVYTVYPLRHSKKTMTKFTSTLCTHWDTARRQWQNSRLHCVPTETQQEDNDKIHVYTVYPLRHSKKTMTKFTSTLCTHWDTARRQWQNSRLHCVPTETQQEDNDKIHVYTVYPLRHSKKTMTKFTSTLCTHWDTARRQWQNSRLHCVPTETQQEDNDKIHVYTVYPLRHSKKTMTKFTSTLCTHWDTARRQWQNSHLHCVPTETQQEDNDKIHIYTVYPLRHSKKTMTKFTSTLCTHWDTARREWQNSRLHCVPTETQQEDNDKIHVYTVYPLRHSKKTMTKFTSTLCTHWDTARRQWQNSRLHCVPIETQQEDNDKIHVYTVYPLRHSKKTMTKFTSTLCTHWDTARRQWQNSRLHCVPIETQQEDNDKIHVYTVYPLRHSKKTMTKFTSTLCTHWDTARRQWQNSRLHCVPIETQQEDNDKIHIYTVYPLRHSKKTMTKFTSTLCTHWDTARRQWQNSHLHCVPIETQQEDNDKIHIYTVYPLRHRKKTMTKFTSTLCTHWDTERRQWQNSHLHCVPIETQQEENDKIHVYTVYPLRHSKKTMTKFTSTLCTHWDTARRQWQNSRLHCVPTETQQEDNDKIHVYTVYPLRHSKKTMTKFTSTLCTHWDTARRQWQNSRLHCVPTETQQEDNDKIHVYTVYPLRHSKKTMTKFTSTLCTHWDTARRQWQNSRLHCVPTETQQEDNDKIHVYTVYPLRHSKKTMTKFTSTLCTHWDTARRQWQNSRLHCVPTETQQEDNDKIHIYTVYPLRHSKKTMTKFTSTLCTHWDTARRQWQNSHLHCVPTETQQEDNDKIHIYTVYPLRHSKKRMTKFTSTLCTHWDTARREWQNSRLHCVPTETQQEENDKIHVYTVYPLRHSKKRMTKFTSTLCTHWDTARREWQNSRLHCVPTETQQEENDKIHVYTVYPLRHSKKRMTKFTSTLCTHWDTARREWQNSRLHCVPTETQQEDNDKIHVYTVYPLRHSKKTMTKFTSTLCTHWDTARRQWQNSRLHCVPIETQQEDNDKIHVYTVYPLRHSKKTMTKFTSTLCTHWDTARRQWQNSRLHCVPIETQQEDNDKIHVYTVYPLRHSKKTMTKFTSTLCTHWDTARRQWQNLRLHCVPIETQQEDNDKIHIYTVYPLRHSKKTMTKFTSTLCTHWDTARRQWQNSHLHCVPIETQQEDNDKIHIYTVYPLRHSKKTMTKFTSTLCTHWDTARRQWQNSHLHCVPIETQQEDNDKIHIYTVYPLRHSKKTMTKFTSTLCTHWDTARREWQNSHLHCVPIETQQEENDKIHIYTVYPLRHSKKTMTKFTSTLCTHWDTARRQWQNSHLHCVPIETQQEDNDKIHIYTVYPLRHSKKTMTKFTSTLCTHWDTARREWQNSHLHCVPIETQQEENDKIHIYTVYPLRHSKKRMTKFTSTLCTHWDTARREWQNSHLHCVPIETQQEDNDKIHIYTVYPLRHSKKTMTKFTSTLCTHWDTARREWQNSPLHCVPIETQQEENDKIHVYTVYPLRHSKKTMTEFTYTLCTHWDTARRQWQQWLQLQAIQFTRN